ncbi:MAG: hypothetical protein CMB80_20475 [Flammeovirgaceae bacterium]|nr:hypothetical protein [Flammeovirgaceae bacterium]HCX23072.1 hypothetical protein [Cytophagales bacterium]|tara:strand:- start:767 stop:952 length:186 start_codon:yes stop_codon:yes gene_type:complete
MKNLLNRVSYSILFLGLAFSAIAQTGPGAPPDTPIDGGLSLLLLAGGAYGIKKLRDHKRNS